MPNVPESYPSHGIWVLVAFVGLIIGAFYFGRKGDTGLQKGVWAWGFVGAYVAILVVLVIASGRPEGIYARINESASAIGAVVAASALAWSIFFQAVGKEIQKESDKGPTETEVKILDSIEELKAKFDTVQGGKAQNQ